MLATTWRWYLPPSKDLHCERLLHEHGYLHGPIVFEKHTRNPHPHWLVRQSPPIRARPREPVGRIFSPVPAQTGCQDSNNLRQQIQTIKHTLISHQSTPSKFWMHRGQLHVCQGKGLIYKDRPFSHHEFTNCSIRESKIDQFATCKTGFSQWGFLVNIEFCSEFD